MLLSNTWLTETIKKGGYSLHGEQSGPRQLIGYLAADKNFTIGLPLFFLLPPLLQAFKLFVQMTRGGVPWTQKLSNPENTKISLSSVTAVAEFWTHPQATRGRRSQPIRDAKCCYFQRGLLSHTLVTARHTLTQCGFVVFGSIALTQQNGCMGAYRVIESEQFPVRISKDKAPTPLTKFGICFFFFFFCHSPFFLSFFLSFFLCITLSDSWRFFSMIFCLEKCPN